MRPAAQARYSRYRVRPRCRTLLLPGGGLARSVQRKNSLTSQRRYSMWPAQLRRGFATHDAKLTCTRPDTTTRCNRCQSGSWPSSLCLQRPRSSASSPLSPVHAAPVCVAFPLRMRFVMQRNGSPTTGMSFLLRMTGFSCPHWSRGIEKWLRRVISDDFILTLVV